MTFPKFDWKLKPKNQAQNLQMEENKNSLTNEKKANIMYKKFGTHVTVHFSKF